MSPRIWFSLLIGSICLEGLGRKFIPGTSQTFWYFLKDGVLLLGMLTFGIGRPELAAASRLLHGFKVVVALAFAWTLLQTANPSQDSMILAAIGLRAYWLWWIAPVVVATAMRRETDWSSAGVVLAVVALVAASVAIVQFAVGAEAAVNTYAWGGDANPIALVAETGRVRVTSTFSYISGYSDFVMISLPLLLALGLGGSGGPGRVISLLGAGALALTVPMTGSRMPVLLAMGTSLIVAITAGTLSTRAGRRIGFAIAAVALVAFLVGGEAVSGVQSRLEGEDTQTRFEELRQLLPPVALTELAYPPLGIGTGMLQNARYSLTTERHGWEVDSEHGKFLAELGVPGYLLVWASRFGLMIALVRAGLLLLKLGRRPAAGAAFALASMTMIGGLAFDHVWQALFFTAAGLLLQPVADAHASRSSQPAPGIG